ncbi:MAG: nitronate monooxygenase [Alphaproteobacteria bacterium]|nr:nitronate monooxygenase [Alphaproteobacteria bacterium]
MDKLHKLWQRGRDFLGTEYAILGGAMTWVSERNLVSAISNAGGFGVLACGSMPAEILEKEIQGTFAMTDKPFGVNLITMHPDLAKLAQVCIDTGVRHVVLAGGLPTAAVISQLKDAGIKVICFTPTLGLAKKLVRMGADALVIEGMEAGGHIGPVSTTVLAQEILPHIREVPVFVAGGIGRGEAIVSFLEMGAAGCQLGTRFVCANECIAHENFKQAFIRAPAREAVLSPQLDARFPVIPVRSLANDGMKEFIATQKRVIEAFDKGDLTQIEAQLEIEHYWAGALRRAVIDGDVVTGSVMAGQSVGLVTKIQSAAEIIQELLEQACASLEYRRSGVLQKEV